MLECHSDFLWNSVPTLWFDLREPLNNIDGGYGKDE